MRKSRNVLFMLVMSDIESIMKFEFLPNEILIECFQYLNTFEIFYSFNQLNNRIDALIHNIPLSINFDKVNKLMFDQFCKTNPEIKNKIYSIKISNKDQCFQAKIFLSYFPLNSFSSLRKFQVIIPSYQQIYGEQPDPTYYLDIKLTDLLSLKLQALTIPYVCQSIFDIPPISSILNLTIGLSGTLDFCQLLKQFPRLKHLRLNHVRNLHVNETDTNQCGIHLEKLILHEFKCEFKNVELFVKQIPNLKSLTISNSYYNTDMINAIRWEKLITSSLLYLKKFELKFYLPSRRNERNAIIDKLKKFQTDFWQNKHWYTEYVIHDRFLMFYTLPYPMNKYQFESSETRYSNGTNRFTNVTHLSIYLTLPNKNHQYYFPNVISISLCSLSYGSNLIVEYIQYLQQIINLSKLKHLEITDGLRIDDLSILLELFKQTPQLSSMIINEYNLKVALQNEELCQHFNRLICVLDTSFWPDIQLDRFCEVFSNLEHLACSINHEDNLMFLIEHLPKLSTLKARFRCKENPDLKFLRFKTEVEKFNIVYHIRKTFIDSDTDANTDEEDAREYYAVRIFIWIGNRT